MREGCTVRMAEPKHRAGWMQENHTVFTPTVVKELIKKKKKGKGKGKSKKHRAEGGPLLFD